MGLPSLTSLQLHKCNKIENIRRRDSKGPNTTSSHKGKEKADGGQEVHWSFKTGGPKHHLDQIDFSYCENLSGETLCEVLRWCPKLHDLGISSCPKITDEQILGILQYDLAPNLHILNLSKMPHLIMIDEIVDQIATKCKALTYLNLSGTINITNGMFSVISSFIGLPYSLILSNSWIREGTRLPSASDVAC